MDHPERPKPDEHLEPTPQSVPLPPPPPVSTGVAEIELRLLDRPYTHLRIREPQAVARQVAALANLANEAQPTLVVVVRREAGRYALIDGDTQVEALVRLGRDTVSALELGLSEQQALSYWYQMQGGARRSALEEGWLVAELVEQGQALGLIGAALGRSVSWVSRRLGLSRALPDKAMAAVRRAVVPPHGAMKSLLPLARANQGHCERLCEQLGRTRVSSRQLEALYTAWRAGDGEQRERIIASPLLFLKAKAAVRSPLPEGVTGELVQKLEAARAALVRAGDAAVRAWSIELCALSSAPVAQALVRCTDAYETLVGHIEEPDARQ